MTTTSHRRVTRTSVVAGRLTLVITALSAWAGGAVAQTVQEATTPTSTAEVGAGLTTDGSYKAGEYNGLQNKGLFGIGQLDFRGGGAFDSDDAMRWRIKGSDLGLDTRSISAEFGKQGIYRVFGGYDELRRNRSDTYQTPYSGAGTTALTLPGTWQVPTVAGSTGTNSFVNVVSARGLVPAIGDARYIDARTTSPTFGGLLTPTATQTALVDAAAAADVPLFHNYNLSTTRHRVDLGLSYNFDPKWGVDASFRPEHKDGVKPMGTVSRNTGADISTTIPDVIDTNTNQVDVKMNFRGAKSFAQFGYYGSYFRNNVASMSWQNWATGPTGTGTLNTMSSAPGNSFNQVTATGGVNFSATAKLVANGSYARNTQNDAFLTDSTTVVVPVNSLNGLVVNEAFNVKLTAKPKKPLNVTAAYKFDNRDNQTAVHIFQYGDAGEAASPNPNFPAGPSNPYGAVLAQNANANRPYSKKNNQFTGEIDYAAAKHHWLKGAYEFQRINRECYNTWISCADAAITNENTLRAEWRAKPTDTFTGRIGYAYSSRRTPFYNENAFLAIVPYANVPPATTANGATAYSYMLANGWTGWGTALGYTPTIGNMNLFFPSNNALANAQYANNNRISELPGMRRYFVSDRDRNKLRALATWQATEALALQGAADYNQDHYPGAVYGLQDSHNWDINVDATYLLGTDVTAIVFYTYEDFRNQSAGNTYTANSNVATITGGQPGAIGLSGNICDTYTTLQQRNNNNKLDPCLNWFTDRLDKVHSYGFSLLWKEVADKPLDVSGNAIVTHARSDNNVTGGNWANNPVNGPGGPPTTIAAFFIPATALPTVSTDTAEVYFNATYRIDTHQSVHLLYTFMHMTSTDWAYEGMQLGSLNSVLPTLEQPFNYNVNAVGASYVLSF
jgi:MtrB/PioB family decaheme-associated outer membrane protein